MSHDAIFARTFSQHDRKKLGCCAFAGCLLIAMSFCTVFKPYLAPLSDLKLRVSADVGLNMVMITEERSSSQQIEIQTKQAKPICNTSGRRSDFCDMSGDIRVQGNSSTVLFIPSNDHPISAPNNSSWRIKPYARKNDKDAMARVREFTISTLPKHPHHHIPIPRCTRNHTVPAVVFSTSGNTGNNFHDFSDVLIPLYLTSREFDGEVQFLITNRNLRWITKFRAVLEKLSKYEVVDIDREAVLVHCFPRVIVGLKQHHREFGIDGTKSPYTMREFRQFLREVYSLKRESTIRRGDEGKRVPLPRILIISRERTRSFVNKDEIVEMARSLELDVVVTEADSDLEHFSKVVNSCDLMMGVHGAGLTNILFLPKNAILIQIIPLGVTEGLARYSYGKPALEMNLTYLEYKIGVEESSLGEQYPLDHQVIRDPVSIVKQGWHPFKVIYLDKQNVELDVGRFRSTLLEAIKLLHM